MHRTFNSKYLDQVSLLIDLLPSISSDRRFAIKGGTAINLFVLDFPRLSVDIDLCYLPLTPRDQALAEIKDFVKELSLKFNAMGLKTREKRTSEGHESTLFVQSKTTEVKVEINLVVRGAVHEPVLKTLAPSAQDMFKRSAEIDCLHPNDLYGGKLCAALDRQNPRDFFDLYFFLKHNNYTRPLHETFMVYLLSSKRPISDLITPNKQDLRPTYDKLFAGMTTMDVDCPTLEETRDQIFSLIKNSFTDQDKQFFMSFKKGEPVWDLFPIENAQNFPSVKWKLHNIQTMSLKKRLESLKKLEDKLA
ncbi:MAG: nucleotidyl transferase AbiEii/AbiGii toxin family protein [Alphaproteobacteria bacterium]|nr:nucleotidyl transferase AbiEii/AbiGii toxin family protein [Alphaproteobacteria bacterium]